MEHCIRAVVREPPLVPALDHGIAQTASKIFAPVDLSLGLSSERRPRQV
jgi:hypothetical protein